MTDNLTRADLDQITQQIINLRIEWRQEMLTNTRWLAGLFVGQFIATVGGVGAVVAYALASSW